MDLSLLGTGVAMVFGAIIFVLVAHKWKKHGKFGTADFAFVFVGLVFLTVSAWGTLEIGIGDAKVRTDRYIPSKGPDVRDSPDAQTLGPVTPVDPPARNSAGIVGSYQGSASIKAHGVLQQIPVVLDIHSESGQEFSGYVSSPIAADVILPVQGKNVRGDVTASATLPDRSFSISLRAKRSGNSISGKYTLSVPSYGLYNLDSQFPSGEFSVSR